MLRLAHDLVDVVDHVEVEPNTSVTDLAAIVKDWVGKEGVVVKFADGRMVKIKGEDYCLKHRALDGLRFEKDVLKLVLENKIDDVLPLVTDEVRARLVAYNDSVLRSIVNHNKSMYAQYVNLKATTDSRAEFAKKALNSPYKTGLFKLYENKSYTLVDFALNKCGSSTDVESIRWLIGKSYLEF
jgi:RNA ligase